MIEVVCKEETHLYNTYHMVKAFYPSAEVTSRTDCFPPAPGSGQGGSDDEPDIYVEVREDGKRIAAVTARDLRRCPDGHLPDPRIGEKKEKKYRIDRALYDQLAVRTGRTLAWGILMGVRPTKLAVQQYELHRDEAAYGEEAFADWFYRENRVSPQKGRLAWRIARREQALLDRVEPENGFSLYVGIPFCPTVCSYCSFSSGLYRSFRTRIDDYLDALCRELSFIADRAKRRGKRLHTIYIGGGTPTTLEEPRFARLLDQIDTCFAFTRDSVLEYTVEAGRPDTITEEKLRMIRAHGATRISINPQTMQQKTLDAVGRRHTVEEVCEAFRLARRIGFDNINMDLIAGLPGETLSDMQDTLRRIRALDPDNLTVHALAIKRAARMGQEHEKPRPEQESPITAMIDAAYDAATGMGMEPYYLYRQKNIAGNFENVGYAKVDKAGIYNILIMEEKETIVAAGAGASTKVVLPDEKAVINEKNGKRVTIIRQENVKEINGYISRIDEMIERKGDILWR